MNHEHSIHICIVERIRAWYDSNRESFAVRFPAIARLELEPPLPGKMYFVRAYARNANRYVHFAIGLRCGCMVVGTARKETLIPLSEPELLKLVGHHLLVALATV